MWEESQDGNPTLGDCKRDGITISIAKFGSVNNLDYSIERYDESQGVYYENKGIAVLYNIAWRTIVYVNLNNIDNETLVLRQYVHHFDILCQMTVIRNWAGCAHFGNGVRERVNQLTKTEDLLKEITGHNFIGELSKILFGTMDEDDVKYYYKQIK